MESMSRDTEAAAPHPIIELPNGDVWVAATDVPGGRRFRYHLGHVVEVFDSGRIRRVGPGLGYGRPWLLADGPLDTVIERALADGGESVPPWQESASAPGGQAEAESHGLLGLLASLLHRNRPAPLGSEVASPWRDTMPWTRQS
jgi:hypothetical protein